MILLHILSPLLYIIYLEIFQYFDFNFNLKLMKLLRKIHNLFLSMLSLFMFIIMTYANIQTNKFNSLHNLLCKKYDNNYYALLGSNLFLYSKYLEWFDTLFLLIFKKNVSKLQYRHHMSTAFLVYIHMVKFISPHYYIFMSLNCIVHTLMYLYFAFSKELKILKKSITILQIIQHVFCLITIIYTSFLNNCKQNLYGNEIGLLLYIMYLFHFLDFYTKKYKIK